MIYQIDISKRTRREIDQLLGHMRQRIKREIAQLAFNPRPTHAVELRGPLMDRYNIVLDQYRIVYWIQDYRHRPGAEGQKEDAGLLRPSYVGHARATSCTYHITHTDKLPSILQDGGLNVSGENGLPRQRYARDDPRPRQQRWLSGQDRS